MDLLSTVTGYFFDLFLYTTLITLTFVVVAVFGGLFANRRGWFNITAGGPRIFKVIVQVGIVLIAIIIGAISGFQIGITSVGLTILDDTGTAIVTQGLAKASAVLGFDGINDEIDVPNAQLLLAKVREVRLVEKYGISAWVINGVFERVRAPFAENAQSALSQYAPDSKIIPADLATTIWGDVYSGLAKVNRGLVMSTALDGSLWFLSIWALILLTTFVLRILASLGKTTKEKAQAAIRNRGGEQI